MTSTVRRTSAQTHLGEPEVVVGPCCLPIDTALTGCSLKAAQIVADPGVGRRSSTPVRAIRPLQVTTGASPRKGNHGGRPHGSVAVNRRRVSSTSPLGIPHGRQVLEGLRHVTSRGAREGSACPTFLQLAWTRFPPCGRASRLVSAHVVVLSMFSTQTARVTGAVEAVVCESSVPDFVRRASRRATYVNRACTWRLRFADFTVLGTTTKLCRSCSRDLWLVTPRAPEGTAPARSTRFPDLSRVGAILPP